MSIVQLLTCTNVPPIVYILVSWLVELVQHCVALLLLTLPFHNAPELVSIVLDIHKQWPLWSLEI